MFCLFHDAAFTTKDSCPNAAKIQETMTLEFLVVRGEIVVAVVEQDQASSTTGRRRKKSSLKVIQSWYIAIFNAILIPVLIILMQIFFDVVPFYPEAGAFILVAGAISMVASLPQFVKFKEINEKVGATWIEIKKINKSELRLLVSRMYVVTAMAGIPSAAGLLYFLVTRDVIASFILCIPAMVMAVLCKPLLPQKVLNKLK